MTSGLWKAAYNYLIVRTNVGSLGKASRRRVGWNSKYQGMFGGLHKWYYSSTVSKVGIFDTIMREMHFAGAGKVRYLSQAHGRKCVLNRNRQCKEELIVPPITNSHCGTFMIGETHVMGFQFSYTPQTSKLRLQLPKYLRYLMKATSAGSRTLL